MPDIDLKLKLDTPAEGPVVQNELGKLALEVQPSKEEPEKKLIEADVQTDQQQLQAIQQQQKLQNRLALPLTPLEAIDVSDAFSRRTEKITGNNTAPTPVASLYTTNSKPIPAWMKKQEVVNKYDKYGKRESSENNSGSATITSNNDTPSSVTTSTSSIEDTSSPYAKYLSVSSTSSSSRTKRIEDPRRRRRDDVDDEDDRSIRRARYSTTTTTTPPTSTTATSTPIGHASGVTPYNPVTAAAASASASATTATPSYNLFKSKINNKSNRDINSIVRTHYNQKTYHSLQLGPRTKSPIYKLRNFNNTIKYILLGNYVKPNPDRSRPTVILDLCCGKGGDLNKCEFVGANQLIGIDISDASVKEAFKRYSQNKARFIHPVGGSQNPSGVPAKRDSRKYNFDACFATGDCFTRAIPDILEPVFPGIVSNLFPVDCVSIQFALHYAFETEEKVKTLLNNVSRLLRPGGTFVGTIPSLDFIREKIVKKEFLPGSDGLAFGNDLYSVTFHQPPPEDGVFRPAFGHGYNFLLKDAIDDVPEYVVPFEVFRLLCEDYGLTLRYKKNFVDLFNAEIPRYFGRLNKNLIEGMKRSDGKYGAEGSEKEAVAFYIGFVFEKVGG